MEIIKLITETIVPFGSSVTALNIENFHFPRCLILTETCSQIPRLQREQMNTCEGTVMPAKSF